MQIEEKRNERKREERWERIAAAGTLSGHRSIQRTISMQDEHNAQWMTFGTRGGLVSPLCWPVVVLGWHCIGVVESLSLPPFLSITTSELAKFCYLRGVFSVSSNFHPVSCADKKSNVSWRAGSPTLGALSCPSLHCHVPPDCALVLCNHTDSDAALSTHGAACEAPTNSYTIVLHGECHVELVQSVVVELCASGLSCVVVPPRSIDIPVEAVTDMIKNARVVMPFLSTEVREWGVFAVMCGMFGMGTLLGRLLLLYKRNVRTERDEM